jgi:hypothetical protein
MRSSAALRLHLGHCGSPAACLKADKVDDQLGWLGLGHCCHWRRERCVSAFAKS